MQLLNVDAVQIGFLLGRLVMLGKIVQIISQTNTYRRLERSRSWIWFFQVGDCGGKLGVRFYLEVGGCLLMICVFCMFILVRSNVYKEEYRGYVER